MPKIVKMSVTKSKASKALKRVKPAKFVKAGIKEKVVILRHPAISNDTWNTAKKAVEMLELQK